MPNVTDLLLVLSIRNHPDRKHSFTFGTPRRNSAVHPTTPFDSDTVEADQSTSMHHQIQQQMHQHQQYQVKQLEKLDQEQEKLRVKRARSICSANNSSTAASIRAAAEQQVASRRRNSHY